MIQQRLAEIREELGQFEDGFSRYAFLVELSAYVPADQPELTRERYLFDGCQSRVWVKMAERDGLFHMEATSDTLIIRGVLHVMMTLFNGCPVGEIEAERPDVLAECGIGAFFAGQRAGGMGALTASIYEFCSRCCKRAQTYPPRD